MWYNIRVGIEPCRNTRGTNACLHAIWTSCISIGRKPASETRRGELAWRMKRRSIKMGERKHYHRGRRKPVSEKRTAMRDEDTKRTNSTGSRSKRKKKKAAGKGRLISNIVLVVAIIVFCVSGFQLYRIISG